MLLYFLNTHRRSQEVHLMHIGCNTMSGNERNAKNLGLRLSIYHAVAHALDVTCYDDANPCENCERIDRRIRSQDL